MNGATTTMIAPIINTENQTVLLPVEIWLGGIKLRMKASNEPFHWEVQAQPATASPSVTKPSTTASGPSLSNSSAPSSGSSASTSTSLGSGDKDKDTPKS